MLGNQEVYSKQHPLLYNPVYNLTTVSGFGSRGTACMTRLLAAA